jgi:class 3 adenylate cyclase/tetratricopeptide (TPR) repeat protein
MHDKTTHPLPATGAAEEVFREKTGPTARVRRATTAFLLTDIDGSTQKLEKARDEMERALERHNEIIHESVVRHGGFIRDWAGDGACAVFRDGKPLDCALEIQTTLQAQNWDSVGGLPVRIGLHCASDTVHGVDKASIHRAARIRDCAWGGQIVLSAAAAAAYPAPDGSELVDFGLCRLRGVDAPIRLFGLVHGALHCRSFPPLRTASAPGAPLPASASPIHGRDQELAAIVSRVAGATRFLTVVGPGGNGKTRLAIEVANRLSETMAVYFTPLAATVGPADTISALARALSLPFHHRTAYEEQLIDYLRDKTALIVLDNADRLVSQCALLETILSACPEVRILATSREPLQVEGEAIFRLHGLRSPEGRDPAFRSTPAYILFAQEAQKAEPGFNVADGEAPVFGEICRMLGGSPLALHLAAQWTRLLSLEEILDKLKDGLSFLTALHGEQQRRRLDGVFQGSWDLLDDKERTALARLSAFQGGFDRQAAQAVAEADIAMLGVLERKSLLNRSPGRRFVMHPLIHEYASDRLASAPGGLMIETHRRHAGYFLEMIPRCFAAARGVEQGRMLDCIEKDLANVQAAWTHVLETKDFARIRNAIEPLFYACALRGLFHDCASLFDVQVEDPELNAYFESIRASCLAHQGAFHAAEALARSAIQNPACPPAAALHCRQALGNIAHVRGDLADARTHYEYAFAARTRLADTIGAYYSAISLALLELQCDDLARARPWVKQSSRICQRLGHVGGMSIVHACAGDIAAKEQRLDDAFESYRHALNVGEMVRHPHTKAAILVKFGKICSLRGVLDQACTSLEEAYEIATAMGDRRVAANALLGLGHALRLKGEPGCAKAEIQKVLQEAREFASHTQLAAALVELARVELALKRDASAARIAALLRQLKLEAPIPECEALIAEFHGRLPEAEEDLDTALLELINEPMFGALRL